jgi:hypothetical protein
MLSPTFWQAVFSHYESDAFLRGFAEAGRAVERRIVELIA